MKDESTVRIAADIVIALIQHNPKVFNPSAPASAKETGELTAETYKIVHQAVLEAEHRK